jgi:hypothetical protein
MPTKRIFDLVILSVAFAHGALILPRLAARRWAREETGPLQKAGTVIQIGMGK